MTDITSEVFCRWWDPCDCLQCTVRIGNSGHTSRAGLALTSFFVLLFVPDMCCAGPMLTSHQSTGDHDARAGLQTLADGDRVGHDERVAVGVNLLHELAAIGGELTEAEPKRHFYVSANTTLTLEGLRLVGGRVVAQLDIQGLNAVGGSILIYGDNAKLVVHSVIFAGCGGNICARHGGSLYIHGGANADISSSSFVSSKALVYGGELRFAQ